MDQEVERERISGRATTTLEDLQPWPIPVAGHRLLAELVSIIRRFVVLPKHSAVTAALWILHSHALNAARCTPILTAQSPVRRCGKTQLQSVLHGLVPRGLMTSNITGPSLFHSIEHYRPTLIVDEFDTFFEGRAELRGF